MPRSVLVVDDDSAVLRLMHVRLKKLGYRPETAAGGLDALNFLGNQPQAARNQWVLLLDIAMPHTDGIASCRILREQGFAGKVLAHTGSDNYATRRLCSQAGFDGFLVKPVDADSLKAAIESLFDDEPPPPAA